MTAKTISVSDLPAEICTPKHGKLPFHAKKFDYWQACGLSWKGNYIKRDGKRVTCGHQHKSKEACERCLVRMLYSVTYPCVTVGPS